MTAEVEPATSGVIERREHAERQRQSVAGAALAAVLDRSSDDDTADVMVAAGSPALQALLVAARAAGATLDPGVVDAARAGRDLGLPELAARLRITVRPVGMVGSWWREDGPPVVAEDEQGAPVALVRRGRSWSAWSAAAGWRRVEDGTTVGRAWCVYPSLPDRPLGVRDVLRVGLPPGSRRDLVRIGLAAVLVAALGAGIPLATAAILGGAVPRAAQEDIVAITVLVAVLVVAAALASIAQGLLLQRLVVQLNVRTTAALWARVVRLEPPFFRDFNAGELTRRVLAVDSIRELVTSSVVAAAMGLLGGVAGLVTVFVLDTRIAWFALGALVVLAVVIRVWLRRMVRARRAEVSARNEIGGFLTALLAGITKVRVAHAERRVYTRWATMFARQQTAATGSNAVSQRLTTAVVMLPGLSSLLVVSVATYVYDAELSIGAFVGLVAALTQVTTAIGLVVPALGQLTEAVPMWDSARPVWQTAPRPVTDAEDPGPLLGRIEISKASFSYSPDAPPVLTEVDMSVAPGEFVAVVGPSGAGKSTLIRLLLGFDEPSAGAVLYDGKPLDTLDLQAVRRQIGVVVQNADVPSGSVQEVLLGASGLGVDRAWEALESAGLAADVRRMPMGMRTVVVEGGSTFSGGQRQRLMIAKALVNRPRLLVFDEATSALDNLTQAVVTRSLQQLAATRIVVAHRLSTIKDADRIYVLEGGRVTEVGTYHELVGAGGMFTTLARRQLA